MKPLRIALLGLAVLSLHTPLWSQESRTWTDNKGRTIRAEFVRVHNGQAMLKMGTRVMGVPLRNLSQADQEYIRSLSEDQGAAEEIASLDGPADPQPRIWTDKRGNQITATFVRLHENQIVLTIKGRVKSLAAEDFSAADQEYVKATLVARGEQALADGLDQYLASIPPPTAGAPQQFSGPPSRPSNFPNFPGQAEMENRMAQAQAEAERHHQEVQQRMAAQQEEIRRQAEQRRQEADRAAQERQAQLASVSPPSGSSPPYSGSGSSSYEPPVQSYEPPVQTYEPPQPMYEEQLVCENCYQVLPSSVRPGDHCPGCNTRFDYVEGYNGPSNNSSSTSSGGSNYRFTGRSLRGIIGLIVLVCGGVAAVGRKLFG